MYCVDSFGLGGKERQAAELVKGLTARPDLELFVVCMDRDTFYDPGVRVQYLPRRCRWDPSVFLRLERVVREVRPDVIHTTGLISSFYALPVAKLYGVPLLNGSVRNAFARRGLLWRLERLLLLWSDVRLANSRAGLASRGLAPSAKSVVVRNGVDLSRFKRHLRERQSDDPAIVGMVAEFNRNKDYATFITAAIQLLAVRRDIRFVAVGDGETLEEIRARLPETCKEFEFLGRRKDVEEIISRFSIGVLATFTEGMSNSIIEYMALGKPVVATDCRGVREVVLDGETGFVVPVGDASALAERIAYLLDHPDVATAMGEAGRRRVIAEFSLAAMVDATLATYNTALRRSPRETTALE